MYSIFTVFMMKVDSSIYLILIMRNKPLINEAVLPKFQKQTLFIVRSKASQPKLQPPAPALRPEHKLEPVIQPASKNLQQCLESLDRQISEEAIMQKPICLRIKLHLIALQEKYNYQQSGYNQNRNELKPPQMILKKHSNRYFSRLKMTTIDDKNKENFNDNGCCNEEIPIPQVDRCKFTNEYEREVQELETKVKSLNQKVDQYEKDIGSQMKQIAQHSAALRKQEKEKQELKHSFELDMQRKVEMQFTLRNSIRQLQQKLTNVQSRLSATQGFLSDRQGEIINLWAIFSQMKSKD